MTYQSKLLLYVGMLIVLLVGTMALSFDTAREVIVASAKQHLQYAALRKQERVRAQDDELLHYTDIIASDMRLQEYLYIILELGTSSESLAPYYQRQFSSLPADYRLIVSNEGKVLLGQEFPRLTEEVRARLEPGRRDHFYYKSPKGVVMVAMGPVVYQGQQLASAVVARVMDQQWLISQERHSAEHLLFFEQDGKILWSSNPDLQQFTLDVGQKFLSNRNQYFRLHQVELHGDNQEVPRLWVGVSETQLIGLLERYERWVYLFALFGGAGVLVVGWLMLRNFRRPFSQLMRITEEMMDGKLPEMSRSHSRSEMDRLVNRFADVLDELRREQAELKKVHKTLQETAITDSLTGMYNRRYLQEVAPGLFAQVERDGRFLTGILLDLDYFKDINDRHGHLGGDAVLVHFSRLLKHNSRVNDHLFRIGGEEFLILNVTEDPEDSVKLANKLRELVAQSPGNYQGVEIPVTVSAGVSCCSGESGGGSLSSLMRAADKALYEAKAGGRNRVVLHGSCPSVSGKRRTPVALVNSEFPIRQ